MLYARILRPPSHGATLTSVDMLAAEEIDSIQVVKDRDFIAVLHEDPEKADWAIQKVKATYSFSEKKVDEKSIFQYLLDSKPEGKENNSAGDLSKGKELSTEIF